MGNKCSGITYDINDSKRQNFFRQRMLYLEGECVKKIVRVEGLHYVDYTDCLCQ